MLTFKTERQNIFPYFFKRVLIAIFILPILYDELFPTTFITDTYYSIATVFLLLKVIDEISKVFLLELTFDNEQKEITILYKTVFSRPKHKRLLFEDAKLEIIRSKFKQKWLSEPLTLYFFKKRKEIFEVKRSKDGFSLETLNSIWKTVESIPLPIYRV